MASIAKDEEEYVALEEQGAKKPECAVEDEEAEAEAGDTFDDGKIPEMTSPKDGITKRKGRPGGGLAMSTVSSAYDVGNKGFLDDTEKLVRSYDRNNDGSIDLEEVKKIVRDLRDNQNQKNLWKNILIVVGIALAIVCLCNFGLVWATLILTRQVESQNGQLVDSSTGDILATKQRGNHITAKVNPEYTRRLAALYGRRLLFGDDEDAHWHSLRRLDEEVPVATVDTNQAEKVYEEIVDGTQAVVTVEVDGVTYSGSVASGVTHSNDGACDIYEHIREDGTDAPMYKVTCCNDECEVFRTSDARRELLSRQLCTSDEECACCGGNCHSYYGSCNRCFSAVSTIEEKHLGRVALKDLMAGQQILTRNGYKEVSMIIHAHPSKPAEFLQIHTEPSSDAPLELTAVHMVFLDGQSTPTQAANVKVGDRLAGLNGSRVVTDIKEIVRQGFYSVLTSDATLVVDGIVASSHSSRNGKEHLDFGGYKIHFHSISAYLAAPLINAVCTQVAPYLCAGQVDDGDGGSMNVLVKSTHTVLKMTWPYQFIIFAGATSVAFVGILMRNLTILMITCLLVGSIWKIALGYFHCKANWMLIKPKSL